jgi:hypothetical protein
MFGCKERPPSPVEEGEPSPNASILPAPLASTAERQLAAARLGADGGMDAGVDAGPTAPEHPAYDRPLPSEAELGRELLGATLRADLRWSRGPAGNRRSPSLLDLSIDLAATGRARVVVSSESFVLPSGTELRARRESWGQVLVWPGATSYRQLPPGTLRALFAEGRADVLPLMSPVVEPGEADELIGFSVEAVKVTTALGSAVVEHAKIPALMTGGQLICRMLLELLGADPESSACDVAVPLRVTFEWASGGSLIFEVRSLTRRQDLPETAFVVPPLGAEFQPRTLPIGGSARTLAKWSKASGDAEEVPFEVQSSLDTLAYVSVDGALAAWLGPSQTLTLNARRAGRVRVAWYDWYGAPLGARDNVAVPGRLNLGATDAGTAEPAEP